MPCWLLALLAQCALGQVATITSSGQWTGRITDTQNDGGDDSNFLQSSNAEPTLGFRFVSVLVPPGATIQSATLTVYAQEIDSGLTCGLENVDNSAPFTTYNQLTSRARTTSTTSTSIQRNRAANISITSSVAEVVSRPGWVSGNNVTAIVTGGNKYELDLFPSFQTQLHIVWTFQSSVMRPPVPVVPVTGNWSGHTITSLNTNLSVGLFNLSLVGTALPILPLRLDAVSGYLSNGMYQSNCLGGSLGSIDYVNPIQQEHICRFACAPGQNYHLTISYCWILNQTQVYGDLVLTHQLNLPTNCFVETFPEIISFPDPVFVPGTLLPFDGRPYATGGGQMSSNATNQILNDRNLFIATVGLQHVCIQNPSPWISLSLRANMFTLPCTLDFSTKMDPPPSAVSDYSTLSCVVAACEQEVCPGQEHAYLDMNYANLALSTVDSLMYPNLPVVLAVSGCVDVGLETVQCPTSGGVRINITMEQSVGYLGISVLVGGSPCTSVYVNNTLISCTLPPGIGAGQAVLVLTVGLVSAPVPFVSYGGPNITTLEGGIGCVADDDSAAGVVAIKMCDRNGSGSVNLTITGTNFGVASIPVVLNLQDTSPISVTKDASDPHRKLYFRLPRGIGSKLLLILTVGLQSAFARVSYEPCPLGQDANCVPCPAGSYGVQPPECRVCQAGRYQALTGQSDCEPCPKGTYQQASGQRSCAACPDKMTSLGVGSDSSQACSSCPVTHYLASHGAGTDRVCAPCAANSLPLDNTCGCRSGYFDNRAVMRTRTTTATTNATEEDEGEDEGSSLNCQPCPEGANCQETGTRSTTMGPLSGWWRSERGTFVQCLDSLNCLGVQWGSFSSVNSSSAAMCLEHRSGVLCAECDVGYQPSNLRGGACIPCDETAPVWLWTSLVVVLVVIGALGMWFYLHRRKRRRQHHAAQQRQQSFSSTNSLTSTGNFSLAAHARNFSSSSTAAGALFASSEAATLASGMRKRKKKDASAIISTGKIMVGFLQILSSMVAVNVALPSAFMQVMRAFSFLNFDFMPWASIRCMFHINFYTRIYVACLYPFVIVVLLLLCVGLPIALSNKRDFQDDETFRQMRSQFVNETITLVLFCVFLLYPWITLQLLQFGICLPIDGKYYLLADMSELCLEGEWLSHLGSVVVLFLLLSVGIPATLGALLYRSRHRLRTEQVRQRLGFLYLAYSEECWWFELVEMSTRVALISIVRFFDPTLHAPLRMGVAFTYIVVVLLKMPYVRDSLDRLALFCMTELLLIACLARLLPVAGQWQGTYIDDLLSAILLSLAFVLFLFVVFQLVLATRWLMRHPLIRRWFQKSSPTRLRVATQFGSMFEGGLAANESESSVADSTDPSTQDDSTSNKPLKPLRRPNV